MRDYDEKKLNSQDDAELQQLRSLVGDAQGDDLSLDDILAEYSEHSRPKSVLSLSEEEEEENLLVFPTSNRPPDPEWFGDEGDEDEQPQEDPTDGKDAPVEEVVSALSGIYQSVVEQM